MQQRTGHADYLSHASLHTTVVQIPKQLLLGYASPHQDVTVALAALLLLVGAVAPLALSAPVRARAAWPLAIGLVAVLAAGRAGGVPESTSWTAGTCFRRCRRC